MAAGLDTPELRNKPELYVDLHPYWAGFAFLNDRRPQGFSGVPGIPAAEILAYLDIEGLSDRDHRKLFARMVGRIDSIFRSVVHEREKKASKGSANGTQPRKR